MSREWMASALCAETDPEAFTPAKGESAVWAKLICGRCDVQAQCLEYALLHHPLPGIWAGTNERDRRALKRDAA